jgi:Organic Anion Transporter Polypeptide (OATP) family
MSGKMEDKGKRRCCYFGLPLFIFNLSGMLLFFMIGNVYTPAVTRTIERRFGLRSSQTGLLLSCNEISNTALVLIIGFFGRRAHKPRVIAVTILFSVMSNLMMALPHLLFSSSLQNLSITNNGTRSGTVSSAI